MAQSAILISAPLPPPPPESPYAGAKGPAKSRAKSAASAKAAATPGRGAEPRVAPTRGAQSRAVLRTKAESPLPADPPRPPLAAELLALVAAPPLPPDADLPQSALWKAIRDLPEGWRGEILEGRLVLSPTAGDAHGGTAGNLRGQLELPFRMGRGGPGGWVFRSPGRLSLPQLRSMPEPDIAGWKVAEAWGLERWQAPYQTVIPDWVCEILSPSNARSDRQTKFRLYAAAGIPHYWIVDPLHFTVEVYERHPDGYRLLTTASKKDVARLPPFDAVELELKWLWDVDPDAFG